MNCWLSYGIDWLKVKTRMAIWVQGDFKCLGYLPLWLYGGLGAAASCPASQEKILPPITSLGKDPNPNSEVQFQRNAYHFCISMRRTKKLTYKKSNHFKLGTICSFGFIHFLYLKEKTIDSLRLTEKVVGWRQLTSLCVECTEGQVFMPLAGAGGGRSTWSVRKLKGRSSKVPETPF